MNEKPSSDFFSGNRQKLRQLIKSGAPIIITANGQLQRNGDSPFPFRQDSNFWYLTGLSEPDLVLVIDKTDEYLIVPGRDSARTHFDGALDIGRLAAQSGISEVLNEAAGWPKLKASLAKASEAATLLASPSYDRHHGLFTNPARARLIRKIKRQKPGLELIDLRKTLAGMRLIKQPAELTAIARAIDITADGIKRISQNLGDFKHEYEIEAELAKYFRQNGASGHAFAPIVAGGKRACTLHNVANDSKLNTGELVVLDVGAEVNNYAADITRTLAYGRPSSRQRQVFEAVLAVQNFAIDLLKPGVDLRDYELQVVQFMGERLVELKLIQDASDRLAVRRYYPHATGHFMGLDVHDVGDYRRPLEPNMVLTVEPGIYIPEEKIGVRIEDDVLITAGGNRILSQQLHPKL